MSFYASTNRQRISERDRKRITSWYSYNYSRVLPSSKIATIVDLGCSEGIALEWLAILGYQNLYGVDSDQMAISIARRNLEGLVPSDHLVVGDILEFALNCTDGSVDLFLMNDVIEHLSKSYLLDLIPEIYRALIPGGSFVVKTGNMENPFNLGLFARDFTHEILFTANSLRQLMVMCGFNAGMVKTGPIAYRTTLRNWPLKLMTSATSWIIKGIARAMDIRIQETAKLIYCIARKSQDDGFLRTGELPFSGDSST